MHFIETPSGLRWHYTTSGRKQPVLFLHGWSFDASVWWQQLAQCSDTFLCIAADLPGCGQSSYRAGLFLPDEIAQLITTLRLPAVDVVAHSLAGTLALQLAYLYPQLIKKIVACDSCATFIARDDVPGGLTGKHIQDLRTMLEEAYPDSLKIFMRGLFTIQERRSEHFRPIWDRVTQREHWPQLPALFEMLRLTEDVDLRGFLPKIIKPVLLCAGDHDTICPSQTTRYLEQELLHAQLRWYEGCGHMPFLTKAEQFSHDVKEFLRS